MGVCMSTFRTKIEKMSNISRTKKKKKKKKKWTAESHFFGRFLFPICCGRGSVAAVNFILYLSFH